MYVLHHNLAASILGRRGVLALRRHANKSASPPYFAINILSAVVINPS